jgi:acetylornithine deacetylase/succinyl-diaminopimelate desuccinylase-like protein
VYRAHRDARGRARVDRPPWRDAGSPLTSLIVDVVQLLQQLIRINTVNPPGTETEFVSLLESRLSADGLKTQTLISPGGRPTLIARVEGPKDRPAIVLLSHGDVVPVEEDGWEHDPFGGEIIDGHVWGRGALDMKSITVMHAAAATALADSGSTPKREVIVVVAADEEAAGDEGAGWFVDEHGTDVGLEEGRPPPEVITEGAYGLAGTFARPVIPIALGEKTAVWFDLVAEGDPGHGGVPPEKQAIVSLASALGDIAGFGAPRVHPVMREQFATLAPAASGANAVILRALASPAGAAVARAVASKLRKASALGLLLADSVTPTQVVGGYKANVVPGEARASFDCRLLPDTDVDEFIARVNERARKYGARVDNIVRKGHGPVSEKGPMFNSLMRASSSLAPDALPTVSLSPVITDARFFRAGGATAYSWCPLILTPELLRTVHGHNERIPVDAFKQAVSLTCDVVREAAS